MTSLFHSFHGKTQVCSTRASSNDASTNFITAPVSIPVSIWILLLLVSSNMVAQHPNVMISDVEKPNEVSIGFDRDNPEVMVAGANIASIYHSTDGGIHWTRHKQESPYGVWGDPVIIADTVGSFYHFHLADPPDGNYIDRIVCQRSDDGGKTWNEGSYTGLNGSKAQDKPWAVVNPLNNEIYVTWTQFDKYNSADPADRSNILFSRSTDQGETWSDPVRINSVSGDCLDDDNTVEGAVPAVGPNGEIYVSWSGPNGLAFNRSEDGGRTWLEEEIHIGDHPGGWAIDIPGIYRANGMPVTKCDLSDGPGRGTIYVNWADQRNGVDDTDIYVAKSEDGGFTWSQPRRVNDDTTSTHQFFTWMDVDPSTGHLYFVFHDRRHHDDDHTDVYLAWSTDGGETFHNELISESPFKPVARIFFGDYNNIWAQDGVVRPVWTRLDGHELTVWTAIVDTDYLLEPRNEELGVDLSPDGRSLIVDLNRPGTYRVVVGRTGQPPLAEFESVSLGPEPSMLDLPLIAPAGIYRVEVSDDRGFYRRQLVWKGRP